MPALGENVTEGTVTRWLKQIGDTVKFDEPLLEVATDKVDTEIPSPVAGVLTDIIANEDDVVEIGAALAVIRAEGTSEPDPTSAPTSGTPPTPILSTDTRSEPLSSGNISGETLDGAPSALLETNPERRSTLEGSAPSNPASRPTAAISTVGTSAVDTGTSVHRVEKLPRIRRTIAARMVESLQIAAQLTTVVEVDISRIAGLRKENKASFQQRTGHKLSYLPFLARAAIEALDANSAINSSLDPDVTEVTYHRSVHLGMAVDNPKGLMVPVIRDAHRLSIAGLARSIAAVAERVRTGKIGPDELTGGTFTITNTGSRGALFDTPIINQPQSAILATGAVVERLKPVYDSAGNLTIAVAPTVHLSLSYDHRIVDGADAARYLTDVKHRLEAGYTSTDLT